MRGDVVLGSFDDLVAIMLMDGVDDGAAGRESTDSSVVDAVQVEEKEDVDETVDLTGEFVLSIVGAVP